MVREAPGTQVFVIETPRGFVRVKNNDEYAEALAEALPAIDPELADLVFDALLRLITGFAGGKARSVRIRDTSSVSHGCEAKILKRRFCSRLATPLARARGTTLRLDR